MPASELAVTFACGALLPNSARQHWKRRINGGARVAVFDVTRDYLIELRSLSKAEFKIGDWAVSAGAHERTVVHGPFPSFHSAFDFSQTELGAVRFMAEPKYGDIWAARYA